MILVQMAASDHRDRGAIGIRFQEDVGVIGLADGRRVAELGVSLGQIAIVMEGIAHIEDGDRMLGMLTVVTVKIRAGRLPVACFDVMDTGHADPLIAEQSAT